MKKISNYFLIPLISFSFFLNSEESILTSHLESIVLGSGVFGVLKKDMSLLKELRMQFQVIPMGMELSRITDP